jgi:hypothetical protein
MINRQSLSDEQRKIVLVIFLVGLAIVASLFTYLFIKSNRIEREMIETIKVGGVIDSITTKDRLDYFKVNNEWVSFSGCGTTLKSISQPNDSIVKLMRSAKISVYRKDSGGAYYLHKTIDCD